MMFLQLWWEDCVLNLIREKNNLAPERKYRKGVLGSKEKNNMNERVKESQNVFLIII